MLHRFLCSDLRSLLLDLLLGVLYFWMLMKMVLLFILIIFIYY